MPRPAELDADVRRLSHIDDAEARLEALAKLQQRPDLSAAADRYLKWLREVWMARAELQDITEGNIRAGEALDRLRKVETPAAEAALRTASKAVKDFLRMVGPNYRRLSSKVSYDQIVGEKRWNALPRKPALATITWSRSTESRTSRS